MSLEKMEALESKIRKAVELISNLKEKNSNLETKIDELQRELSSQKENLNSLKEEKEKVDKVFGENRQLLEERDTIKTKIETMILSLDEIDIG